MEKKNLFFDRVKTLVQEDGIFQTWFGPTAVEMDDDNGPTLWVPYDFSKDWISRKYRRQLDDISRDLWKKNLTIHTREKKGNENDPKKSALALSKPSIPNALMHDSAKKPDAAVLKCSEGEASAPRSGFDEFISGRENLLAFAAAKAISPGSTENSPFVMIGGNGMGKSHLAKAIASRWDKDSCAYLHAEEFGNSYVHAIMENRLHLFRSSVRNRKLLVMEDLDFFLEGNKKKTLDELIHTFKVFKREKRQVVITSCRPVCDYEAISRPLSDFLLSGLKVRLCSPEPESRRAMIEAMAAGIVGDFPKRVKDFLAAVPFSSAGELCAAVKQLCAFARVEGGELPLGIVKEILADHLRMVCVPPERHRNLHDIAAQASRHFGIPVSRLLSSSRERHVAMARHTAMLIAHDEGHHTLRDIGRFFGGRMHQSVLFAIQKMRRLVKNDKGYAESCAAIRKELGKFRES